MHRVILLAAAAAVALAAPAVDIPPVSELPAIFSGNYRADAVMELPYAAIAEPITVYFDAAHNRSKTVYYNGMDTYIYRANENQYFQISPVSYGKGYNQTCFQVKGDSDSPIRLQTFFPTNFGSFQAMGTEFHRGIDCILYYYNYTVEDKRNEYFFYIDAYSRLPVSFEMYGYDALLGSHYDTYILTYNSFTPNAQFNDTEFDPPASLKCGNFPGPGVPGNSRGGLLVVEDAEKEEQMLNHAFAEHKARYNRNYADAKEEAMRHMNFRHNKRFVESTNRRGLTYKVALNHLADYTKEERKMMRGVRSSRVAGPYKPETVEGRLSRPPAWDWRLEGKVTPVKDQGICGSCWSFGSAEAMESAQAIKHGQLVELSQQAFMDCSWGQGNNACDGGEAFRAYEWVLKNGFLPTASSYGMYLMADGMCHVQQATKGASLQSYVNVSSGDMDTVLNTVYVNGPLAVAIDASHEGFSFYSDGVYYDPACGNTPDDLDHEVLLVGYGTDPVGGDYWLIKNSWSDSYGDQGYIKMSRKDNNCGVATDATLPVVA